MFKVYKKAGSKYREDEVSLLGEFEAKRIPQKAQQNTQFYGSTESHQYEPDENEVWRSHQLNRYGMSYLCISFVLFSSPLLLLFSFLCSSLLLFSSSLLFFTIHRSSNQTPGRPKQLVDVCKETRGAPLVADLPDWGCMWCRRNLRRPFYQVTWNLQKRKKNNGIP